MDAKDNKDIKICIQCKKKYLEPLDVKECWDCMAITTHRFNKLASPMERCYCELCYSTGQKRSFMGIKKYGNEEYDEETFWKNRPDIYKEKDNCKSCCDG